jgi:phosphinothricin acetyltransferase
MIQNDHKREPIIRRATIADLAAITEIYNDAIVNTVATFDEKPKTMDEQVVWFKSHGPKFPVLVAEIDGKVIGWCSLSEWSDRAAYSDTAELSIYVDKSSRAKGIGTQLLKVILDEAVRYRLHSIIARIESGNSVIIHLLEKYSFTNIGIMKEVGKKFGHRLDVVIMQLVMPA